MNVERIDSLEQFEGIRDVWNRLLEASPAANVFLSWEWLYAWWKVYGAGKELYVLVARDGDEVVGLAPFFRSRRSVPPLKTLQFMASEPEDLGSDYLDLILHPQNPAETLAALLDYLEHNDDWDAIRLSEIPEASFTVEHLQQLWGDKYACLSRISQTCPYVKLPQTWDDFLYSIGARTRKNIRQAMRRFERDGFRIEHIAGVDHLAEAMEHIIRLNEARARNKDIPSPFADTRFCEFHRRVAAELGRNGYAGIYLMRQNGDIIAGKYLYSFGRRRFGYMTAIDDRFARLSPGVGLLARCIEDAIAQGMEEFDLLRGRESWKYHWTTEDRHTLIFEIYGKAPAAMASYSMKALKLGARNWLRNHAAEKV